jgi:hypothetical protein
MGFDDGDEGSVEIGFAPLQLLLHFLDLCGGEQGGDPQDVRISKRGGGLRRGLPLRGLL